MTGFKLGTGTLLLTGAIFATPPAGGVGGALTDAFSILMGRAKSGPDGSSAGAGTASFSILGGGGTMGAGGGAVSPFFCRLDLCDGMVVGGGV